MNEITIFSKKYLEALNNGLKTMSQEEQIDYYHPDAFLYSDDLDI